MQYIGEWKSIDRLEGQVLYDDADVPCGGWWGGGGGGANNHKRGYCYLSLQITPPTTSEHLTELLVEHTTSYLSLDKHCVTLIEPAIKIPSKYYPNTISILSK